MTDGEEVEEDTQDGQIEEEVKPKRKEVVKKVRQEKKPVTPPKVGTTCCLLLMFTTPTVCYSVLLYIYVVAGCRHLVMVNTYMLKTYVTNLCFRLMLSIFVIYNVRLMLKTFEGVNGRTI